MTSQAERLRQKRARQQQSRQKHVAQFERSEPADKLALTVRAKHLGLTYEQAKDQRAGTAHGVWCIKGKLTDGQYRALESYRALRSKWQAVNGVPGVDADPSNGGDMDPAWKRQICEQHEDMIDALKSVPFKQSSLFRLEAVLDHCVLRGHGFEPWFDLVKLGADALVVHFGLDGASRSRYVRN